MKGKDTEQGWKDYKHEKQGYHTRIAKTINMKSKDTIQGLQRL